MNMSVTTTTKISLDLYNNSVVTINAKQADAGSRYLNITCTDYGRKVTLDASSVSAFVRYKKSDGNNVFNIVNVLEDGTLQVELTQQMLAIEGRQSVDVMLVAATGVDVDKIADVTDFSKLGASVISTMLLYINVVETAVDNDEIASTPEYDALTTKMAELIVLATKTEELKDDCVEATRDAEKATAAANHAATIADMATASANQAAAAANHAATIADMATASANQAANSVSEVVTRAEEATDAANTAADVCNGIADKTGVVLNNDTRQQTMVGDLSMPNLMAESVIIGGKAKLSYDTNSDAIVLTFL
jgi:methyl-accepting chemotaxis protein